jgi:hypothetical protein
MPKIDNLKTLLNFNITDGTKKIRVYVNETNQTKINAIFLFYLDNEIMALGQYGAKYYNQGIQIVCRHNDYDKARAMAFDTIEYISTHRKTFQGVYFMPELPPTYTGKDELTGGHTWSVEIRQKGGE